MPTMKKATKPKISAKRTPVTIKATVKKTTPKQVKIGSLVECIVTGFSGIVTQRSETLTSGERFGVTPKAKSADVYPDSILMDMGSLKWKGKGHEDRVLPPLKHNFKLGDKVRSTLRPTDTGTIIAISTYINGCVNVEVERDKFVRDVHERSYFTNSVSVTEHDPAYRAAPLKKLPPSGGPPARISPNLAR